jgi:hypothetical protein
MPPSQRYTSTRAERQSREVYQFVNCCQGSVEHRQSTPFGVPQIPLYSPWPTRNKGLVVAFGQLGWPIFVQDNETELLSAYKNKAFQVGFIVTHSDGRFLKCAEQTETIKRIRGYGQSPIITSTRTFLTTHGQMGKEVRNGL